MDKPITVPAPVQELLDGLHAAGFEACAVGGCVRDSLLGITPHDWDVCTSARPEQVKDVFSDRRVVETGVQHGTVTVLTSLGGVEITAYRRDGAYLDGRRPETVTFGATLTEDLARRDFTVNAMAWDGRLIDPFGGQEDLQNGILRCVGEAEARFHDDALRILRALRFMSRFYLTPDSAADAAIHGCRGLLDRISPERVFAELKGILLGPAVEKTMLSYGDVFAAVIPELAPCLDFDQKNRAHDKTAWGHTARAVALGPLDETARLTLLFHDIGKIEAFFIGDDGQGHFYGHPAISRRMTEKILTALHCDRDTLDTVLLLVEHHDDAFPDTMGGMKRLFSRYGERALGLLIGVRRADVMAHAPWWAEKKIGNVNAAQAMFDEIVRTRPCVTLRDLAVTGDDLLALGFAPGPALGQTLQTLLDAVIDGELANEKEQLLRTARKKLL